MNAFDVTGRIVCLAVRTDGATERAPLAAEVLSWLGNKWVAAIMIQLRTGPLRHRSLKRQMKGVSQRMLTLTLRNLERDGIVERKVHSDSPPCVTYELTPLGSSLQVIVQAVDEWARTNLEAIEVRRRLFDDQAGATDVDAAARRIHRIL